MRGGSKTKNNVIYAKKNADHHGNKADAEKEIAAFTSSPVMMDKKEMKSTAPPKFTDLAGLAAALAPKGLNLTNGVECLPEDVRGSGGVVSENRR